MADAYPLQWPAGWPRTEDRQSARFKTRFARARDELIRELELMGAPNWSTVISSNVPLRRDGLPYARQAEPSDPGVAVYFRIGDRSLVMACDRWDRVVDNLQALRLSIGAIRGLERWGPSQITERAFTGFAALPSGEQEDPLADLLIPDRPWHLVLEVPPQAPLAVIAEARRRLARRYHPDGSDPDYARMVEINAAFDEAMKERLAQEARR